MEWARGRHALGRASLFGLSAADLAVIEVELEWKIVDQGFERNEVAQEARKSIMKWVEDESGARSRR